MAQTTRPPPPRRMPPFAEETADSRIGLSTGLYGAQNVTRTWRVYCTSPTANPAQTLLALSSKDGGVRIGETFPKPGGWGDGTYVLLYLTILDHWIGTNVWILQGYYGPSYLTNFASNLWEFNIRGSLQSERVFTTLPYTDNGNHVPSKGIGPPEYTPKTGPTGSFYASIPGRPTAVLELAGGSTTPTDPKLPRFMDGTDAPRRISTLNLWKVIPAWNFGAVAAAFNNKNYVNSDDVIVSTTSGIITFASTSQGGRGIMMIEELTLDPIPPGQTGTPQVGIGPAFRVGLALKINPDGWQHSRRHTYRSDSGVESPIYDSQGNFIDEEFRVVGETSFSALIGAFT